MVVILVILMFASLVLVGVLRRSRAEARATALAATTPLEDIWFHPGHAWAASVGGGLYKVGLNEVAASLAGMPERFELPVAGASLRQSRRQLLVRAGERLLSVAAPLSGKVVDVNRAALEDPALVARHPYGAGWLLLVKVRGLRDRGAFLLGEAARRWLNGLREKAGEVAGAMSPATALDGGSLRPGFGDDITDEKFEELKAEFFGREEREA